MSTEEELPLTEPLPDTQNINSQDFEGSQDVVKSQPTFWGMLYAAKETFQNIRMHKDIYTVGRSPSCDIVINNVLLPNKSQLDTISKVHFCIIKETSLASDGLEDTVVYVEDLSRNGTYVNDKIVGRGKRHILVNDDLIGLSMPKKLNVYVFMSRLCYEQKDFPIEVKDKYAIARTLGSGAYGEVKLALSKKTTEKFAMKIIAKKGMTIGGQRHLSDDPRKIMNEVEILKTLKHPCVIKMQDIIDTPPKIYIIFELMEGGELLERIRQKRLKENIAKVIFYQVVLAVQYLHKSGITHRDLKPENILLACDKEYTLVKVTDFGLSKFMDAESMMKTFCGTAMYVAPEVLRTHGRGTYTKQVDVWSLGVILYCCLSGITPFRMDAAVPLQDQILAGLYNFPNQFNYVSSQAISLIKQMMTVDANRRITINGVILHSWLQDRKMRTIVNQLLNNYGYGDENIIPLENNEYKDDLPQRLHKHARLSTTQP